jgi:hypothetical protein
MLDSTGCLVTQRTRSLGQPSFQKKLEQSTKKIDAYI